MFSKTETLVLETEKLVCKVVVSTDSEEKKKKANYKMKNGSESIMNMEMDMGLETVSEHIISLTINGNVTTMNFEEWSAFCALLGKVQLHGPIFPTGY